MPGPYKPPQIRRAQAVRSARGITLQRWWWLAPLIGLVPVLTVLALVSRGGGGAPVASGPTAAPTIQSAAVVTQQAALTATTQPLAAPPPIATATTAQGSNTSTSAAAAAPATPSTTSTTAPPVSPTPASSTLSGPYVAYRVQPGDTVRFIAQTYGVSPISIAQASGLQNPDVLRVGQLLTIPAQPGWLYRLQPGETLDQVSARTGVASSTIASASGLAAASVGPGSVILIPDQTLALSK